MSSLPDPTSASSTALVPPPPGFRGAARVQSLADYEQLYRQSLADPEHFWREQLGS